MFQRIRNMQEKSERGFTLIELLVVILIIAILAAIAIPVFMNQRKKGYDGQVQSALKNAATAVETIAASNQGSYTSANNLTQSNLGNGYVATENVTFTVTADADDYCILSGHALLEAADTWDVATFDSDVGRPDGGTDTCTL